MSRMFQRGVFIARCQPPHKAHVASIRAALRQAERVAVLLGSSRQPSTPRNPWSFTQRMEMLSACFDPSERQRLGFFPVRDHPYSDAAWVVEVQRLLSEFAADLHLGPEEWPETVALFGHRKDRSTGYLGLFPQLAFVETGWDNEIGRISATEVREAYFEGRNDFWGYLPAPVAAFLESYRGSADYLDLAEEHQYVKGYREAWKSAPHPPTFLTADAVVFQSGHVLMVRRKGRPGRGQLALPGGFVEASEFLLDAALRELREETGLRVPEAVLRSHLAGREAFDHPDRSLRGRTVSHAFAFRLPDSTDGFLPGLNAGSDAARAQWVGLRDLLERTEQVFEDHTDIILHFANLS